MTSIQSNKTTYISRSFVFYIIWDLLISGGRYLIKMFFELASLKSCNCPHCNLAHKSLMPNYYSESANLEYLLGCLCLAIIYKREKVSAIAKAFQNTH